MPSVEPQAVLPNKDDVWPAWAFVFFHKKVPVECFPAPFWGGAANLRFHNGSVALVWRPFHSLRISLMHTDAHTHLFRTEIEQHARSLLLLEPTTAYFERAYPERWHLPASSQQKRRMVQWKGQVRVHNIQQNNSSSAPCQRINSQSHEQKLNSQSQ